MDFFSAIWDRAQHEPGPIWDVQLLVDAVQVNFHGVFSHSKLFRDNFIREPLRDKPGYLCFPSRHRLIANTISRPTICIVRHSTLLSGI
jgi:hypothetical protein